MTFVDWLQNTRKDIRENGFQGVSNAAYEFYVGMWQRVGRIYSYGTPIYDEEWDVLVFLDACRADLMAEVASSYPFVDTNSTASVASESLTGMDQNFLNPGFRE